MCAFMFITWYWYLLAHYEANNCPCGVKTSCSRSQSAALLLAHDLVQHLCYFWQWLLTSFRCKFTVIFDFRSSEHKCTTKDLWPWTPSVFKCEIVSPKSNNKHVNNQLISYRKFFQMSGGGVRGSTLVYEIWCRMLIFVMINKLKSGNY